MDAGRPAAVDAQLQAPRALVLDTTNVRRFRITRRNLPIAPGGSIALRVDGQVFEWTTRRAVLELAYTPSGGWRVVDRSAPR